MSSKIKTQDDFKEVLETDIGEPYEFTTTAGETVKVSALENEYCHSTRWEEVWRIVWHEFHGDTYAYYYRVPATEYQESSEEFYHGSIFEVVAKAVTVIKYEKKPKSSD